MSTVPKCWHGDVCPWLKRDRCLFKHCAPPPVELTGGEVPVEQQLRDLRRALQRLAAAVMWRDVKDTQTVQAVDVFDVPVPQIPPQARTSERIVEHFVGVPVPQIQERILEVAEIIPQKRIPECIVGQIDDVPVPQILNEIVEVEQAVKTVAQERISEGIGEQIVDDIVPVDQPGDQARCDTQECGDAEKGPSDSDCLEDSGTPSDSESDLAESSDEGSAEEAKRPRLWSRRHWGRRQGSRDDWSRARDSWSWRW